MEKVTDNLARQKRASKIRGQFITFFFFLVFSAATWTVIKLSNQYGTTVSYEVQYINQQPGRVLTRASSTTVTIGLEASGFDVVRFRLRNEQPPLRIDLSAMTLQATDDGFTGKIISSSLVRSIIPQLSRRVNVLYIHPDTLFFNLKTEYKKLVPVQPDLKITFRPQYGLYQPLQLKPDSVWVYGVRTDLETIEWVKTVPANVSDLYRDQQVVLPIALPKVANPVRLSAGACEATLRIEKFTEEILEVPVHLQCSEPGYSIRIFPEKVKLTCLVALIDYKRLDASGFEATVRCEGRLDQGSTRLKVNVTQFPDFVQITRIEPERLEFIKVRN